MREASVADGFHGADVFALAQDGYAVRDGEHLVQLVRDDDDGFAVRLHAAHDSEQLLRLLRGEHGCRLIENQQLRTVIEHLDDLQRLLLADAHLIDLLVEIDLKVIPVADLAGLGLDGLQVVFFVLIQHERDVLGGSEDVDQLEMLMHHADTVCIRILGAADLDRLAAHDDLALVRIVDAGDHVHQRRFAAAVLSEQGEDLAAADIQRYVSIGDNAAECLGDVMQFKGVFHTGLLSPLISLPGRLGRSVTVWKQGKGKRRNGFPFPMQILADSAFD